MLEIDMETGKLTLPLYLEQVKERLKEEQALAFLLHKQGKTRVQLLYNLADNTLGEKQNAVRVFRRVKIMQGEIQGAEG